MFCTEDHLAEACSKVKGRHERKNVLIIQARCFSCLKKGHRSLKCILKVACKLCKGKHHCAIRPTLGPHKEVTPQPSAPVLAHHRELQDRPNATLLNPSASLWVGNTGKDGSVALQTALALVDGKRESKVRVLFDSGSHRSFITANAVGKLKLKPVRTEQLGIKVFGASEADTAMREVVEFSLGPLSGRSSVKIEAFVVEDISCIPNIHPEIVKNDYDHLRNIWFSDVCKSDDMLEVDCLLGSDQLWSFQEEETKRGGHKTQWL